jgi:hypothetical protein
VTGVVGPAPAVSAVAVDELLQVGDVVAFPLPAGAAADIWDERDF